MELSGRIALVTGGGTGLGAEVCRQLGRAGARVAVNYSRSALAAEALVEDLRSLGAAALAVAADVADEASVIAMVRTVENAIGPIDLLVNNAGVTTYVPFVDLAGVTAQDWERILGVNVVGTWNCTRAVAEGMRDRGVGAIVNVASDSAFTFDGSSIPYVVSKAAVVALTRALDATLRPAVRVSAVAPGWMDTPWIDRYLPGATAAQLRADPDVFIDTDEVARAIVELLADDGAGGTVRVLSPGYEGPGASDVGGASEVGGGSDVGGA